MVKGNLIIGIIFCMIMLKKLLKVIIIKKPIPTPKQKGKVFDKPCCLANTIAIKLLGPGVKLVIVINTKKENTGKYHHLIYVVCYNVRNGHYNVVCFIIHNVRYIVYKRRLDDGGYSTDFCSKFKDYSREREIKFRESITT